MLNALEVELESDVEVNPLIELSPKIDSNPELHLHPERLLKSPQNVNTLIIRIVYVKVKTNYKKISFKQNHIFTILFERY